MSVPKTAREAIEEFVEAIAEHYVAVKLRSSDGEQEGSGAEEFVSAIEYDLRSTLRDRLSKLDTAKESELAPTVDLTDSRLLNQRAQAGIVGDSKSGEILDADLGETLDTSQHPELGETTSFELPARDDTKRGPGRMDFADGDTVSLDPGIAPDGKVAAIKAGGSSNDLADLSYDRPTMDSGNGHPARSSVRSGSLPDLPKDYEILSVLGRGGMGIVYKARHLPLDRLVALKMILHGANASKDQLNRFQREAEAAARLSHPNIVSIYEVGSHKGLPYFSLEFIQGCDLSDLMKQQTMSAMDAAKMLVQVARAVHYSHQMGILHRDLKPQNILLTENGVPKVADFGLAKRLDDDIDQDAERTREGVIVGTPGYMAPEQASGNTVGPPTDIYALGSILYYMMTGRPPFTAPTPLETVRQLLDQDPVWPSKLQTDLDKDLETICLKSLEKDPKKRYQTAEEFADELQRFLNHEPILARPITRRERVWKWCQRNPVVASLSGLAAGLVLCLLFGGIISALVINEQKKAEELAKHQAEENAKLSHDTTRLVLYDTKSFFNANPELQPLRESLMTQIVEKLERHYAEQTQENPSAVFAASADRHLGQIYVATGDFRKAIDKLEKSQNELRALAAENKVSNATSSQMHITLGLGDAHYGLGEIKKAEKYYLDLEKQCLGVQPGQEPFDMVPLATLYGRLGKVYRNLGNPEKSREYFVKAERLHRTAYEENPKSVTAMEELSGALGELGRVYEREGDTERMLESTHEAIRLKSELPASTLNTARKNNLARDQKNLAQQYLLVNQERKSKELLEKAAETVGDLLDDTDDARIQSLARNTYYLQGIVLQRLGEDGAKSFARAEGVQRRLIEKSDSRIAQGELLKILARMGRVDDAMKIADQLADESDESIWNCGYAACGYALIAEHLPEDDPQRAALISKSIDITRKLIQKHQYHDFESLRSTDIDFEPLQQNKDYLKMLEEEQARVQEQKVQEKN
jgi:serine/threonine-protein kinase